MKKVEFKSQAILPRKNTEFTMRIYNQDSSRGIKEHVAIIKGDVTANIGNVIRVHSSCVTSEIFGCTRCDCSEQLDTAFEEISKATAGAIIYLDQEGRDIGLAKKVEAYSFQDQGLDTVDANLAANVVVDARNYAPALQILQDIGITHASVLTNNPNKITELVEGGLHITNRIPVITEGKEEYLAKKVSRLNHEISFNPERDTHISQTTISGFKPIK
jgi:3,4-dihydroxy 2-butanone 4-phosphate synthase / GTP cyclohydrolase II